MKPPPPPRRWFSLAGELSLPDDGAASSATRGLVSGGAEQGCSWRPAVELGAAPSVSAQAPAASASVVRVGGGVVEEREEQANQATTPTAQISFAACPRCGEKTCVPDRGQAAELGCGPRRHVDLNPSWRNEITRQVRHDDIVEHVSSILKSNGIAHSGKSIDTGKFECYQHDGGMPIGKSDSQRVGYGETIEADKSSSDTGEVSKMILGKQPPKGLAIKEVRNMFFPYWKSVLSRRLQLKIVPSCQPSRKDLLSAEASRKGTKSIDHPCNTIKSMGNRGLMSSESRRMLYTVASMSRKVSEKAIKL